MQVPRLLARAARVGLGLGFVLAVLGALGLASPCRSQEALGPELVARTEARTPEEERKGFHLPPGFEIQLVAADPDINKPMNIAFDDRGRLWVTSTIEYPYPAAEGTRPRDSVKILEDFGPDGRARKITTFADGLNIPIGVLPLADGALVHSIPNLYHLIDADGDGKADRREIFYKSYGFRDTHGMTNALSWGFDGWIYACHGFNNDSEVKGSDGRPILMNSGNTYRMRPDGSHVEYFTHGQVNPFGLSFDPLGNVYSCDCHTKPLYQLLRGAWYPSFGKPHDGLDFGPEMCKHDHGSTGIAGVTYYAAEQFPTEYRGTIFVGNVVTTRINHDKIKWHGSSPEAVEQPDFVSSDDPWFRPVDFELGTDGALYVADFYNRIIGHYEVPLTHPGRDRTRGRIWRIVYTGRDGDGKPVPPPADFTKYGDDELVKLLADPNIAVRIRAANLLVRAAKPATIEGLGKMALAARSAWERSHALWIVERKGALDDATLTRAAEDRDLTVRVHAMRVLSERITLDDSLRSLLLAGLKDADPNVRRAAADALGRHPQYENLRPLLDLRRDVPADDTHLLHVTRMALRDQLLSPEPWEKLQGAKLSDEDRSAIADVATGVHTAEAARYLAEFLSKHHSRPEDRLRFVHHIARFGGGEIQSKLLEFISGDQSTDLAHQAALLKALQQGTQERGSSLSGPALETTAKLTGKLLESKKSEEVQAGIELAGSLHLESAGDAVVKLAKSRQTPEAQRVAAFNTLTAVAPKQTVATLADVLDDAGDPIGVREQAAGALARLNRPEAQERLVKSLPTAPARLQTAIATGLAGSSTGAETLLEAIKSGKASARLLQERGVEVRLPASKLPNITERVAELLRGLPPADQKSQELIGRRRSAFASAKGTEELGLKVFEKNCGICHQIKEKGAKVGPNLDGVGARGLERLLEDVLDPNRNVDQAFRTTNLALKNGQLVSGMLLREEGEVLVMADQQGKEVRVPKSDVEERVVTQLSPMPANLSEQISEKDFNDLLAYLLSQTPPKGPESRSATRP